MPYTKRFFMEITSLEPISDNVIYLSLSKNIKNSYVKLYKAELIMRDIH